MFHLWYFLPVMLKAATSSNMVLVKTDPGRDVNLVGIDDATGRNVVRVQASARCVLHHRIRARNVILTRACGTRNVHHWMVVSG